MFSVDIYNQLPSISDADKAFQQQLKSSSLTFDMLLSELAPLFSEGENAGRYAIWILHHHFDLKAGERMVEKENTTKPTTDTSPNIVAERWNAEGEELEYKYVDDINDVPPPPSADFLKRFKAILDVRKIDALGVCYACNRREIQEGYVFMETTNHADSERKHVVTPIRADDPSMKGNIFYTSWQYTSGHQCGWAFTQTCCWG